jgi:hypothetical protein
MKTQTAISRILKSEGTIALKVLKLEVLALRTFPSSPNQKLVIATAIALQNGENPSMLKVEDFYVS